MKKLKPVADAVRRIIMRWAVTRTNLIANASAGDTSISVKSTRRWAVGDQFVIHNNEEDMEHQLFVRAIVGKNTIQIGDAEGNPKALQWNWPVSTGGHVVKSHFNQLVKAVFLGDPDIITDLPAITVDISDRNSDWYTIGATKEKYNLEIAIYVSGTTQEEGDSFLWHMADQIQAGLKRNFYPLLDDYKTVPVTVDILAEDRYIKVQSTSIFAVGQQIIIEDEYNIEVHSIEQVCDADTLKLAQQVWHDFDAADTVVIRPNRLPFNSWPTDIKFGKIKKGTLLKAAVISYFVEETEDQLGASFSDPQLQ